MAAEAHPHELGRDSSSARPVQGPPPSAEVFEAEVRAARQDGSLPDRAQDFRLRDVQLGHPLPRELQDAVEAAADERDQVEARELAAQVRARGVKERAARPDEFTPPDDWVEAGCVAVLAREASVSSKIARGAFRSGGDAIDRLYTFASARYRLQNRREHRVAAPRTARARSRRRAGTRTRGSRRGGDSGDDGSDGGEPPGVALRPAHAGRSRR